MKQLCKSIAIACCMLGAIAMSPARAEVNDGSKAKPLRVMLVPSDALAMEKTAAFLFVAEGGKANRIAVAIGFNDGKNVEIKSGLAETQKVIVVGKLALTSGQAVKIAEEK